MKFKYIISILLFTTSIMYSQKHHEFSVNLGLGSSALNYVIKEGNQQGKDGGQLGLGYAYFFNRHLGISTGIEMALYSAKASFDNPIAFTKPGLIDDEMQEFDFYSEISNLHENQNAALVNIPLLFHFQSDEKNKIYVSAGMKIGLPVNARYESKANFTNKGLYTEPGTWVNTEFMGFGKYEERKSKGELDLKIAYIASLEAGMKWKLSEKLSLSTGLFFDYGLNNIRKSGTKELLNYDLKNPENFYANSILLSTYTKSEKVSTFTDKVIPMAVGIKLRLAYLK